MKQIWILKHGGPNVLKIREIKDPSPRKREVLIDVHFSGINFADILARMGLYRDAPKIPCVVGYEVSGKVVKIGEEVDEFWLGKKVTCLTKFGGYSSKVVVPTDQIIQIPEKISLEAAASFPVTYLTAYVTMVLQARLQKGETVLIHGVGGGVGLSAFQIAQKLGVDIIGTASGWKHNALKKMGIMKLIDYHTEDFVERVLFLTDGRGVDLVLDPIGGQYVKKSFQCLRPLGRVVFFGSSSAAPGKTRNIFKVLIELLSTKQFHPIQLMNQNKGVFGCNLGHLWQEKDRIKASLNQLMTWLSEGSIYPVVDKIFPFEEASDAHQYIQDHRNIGKVLLSP